MESKIQELADKLLREGVEAGQSEAEKIIAEANKKAMEILEAAKSEAEDITVKAKKEAENLQVNTKSEIKMYAGQALNALKGEIANIVTDKVVRDAASALAKDTNFMQQFMLRMAEKWGTQEDIVISTADAESLKAVFAKDAKALLDKSVCIEQINGQKTAFVIQPADGSYKVSFGEAEFTEYFRNFLRPQLIEMLF